MNKKSQELPDDHYYQWITIWANIFSFLFKSVKYYIKLIEGDISEIEKDEDLKELLDEDSRRSFRIYQELKQAKNVSDWMEKKIKEGGDDPIDYDFHNISHGTIRYLKSIGHLYIRNLKVKRNRLSSRPNLSHHTLETVDTQISKIEEQLNTGVFGDASPKSLLVEEMVSEDDSHTADSATDSIAYARRPTPVLIDSIQILDTQLHERCMDLFQLFTADGKQERLDTVLSEATKILENHLRKKCKTEKKIGGTDLASHALSGKDPIVCVSESAGEQEAAHLIFRGIFGLVRNPSHHELMGVLNPNRVLQLMGIIDYLLRLLDVAKTK